MPNKKKTLQNVALAANVFGLATSLVPFIGGYTLPFPFVEIIRSGLVLTQSALNLSVGIAKKDKFSEIENSLVLSMEAVTAVFALNRFGVRNARLAKNLPNFQLLEKKPLQRSHSLDSFFESHIELSQRNYLKADIPRGGATIEEGKQDERIFLQQDHYLQRNADKHVEVPLLGPPRGGAAIEKGKQDDRIFLQQDHYLQRDADKHVEVPLLGPPSKTLRTKEEEKIKKAMTSMLGRFAIADDDVTQASQFLSKGFNMNKSVNRMVYARYKDIGQNITMFDRPNLSLYEDDIRSFLKEKIFQQDSDERQSYLLWYMRQVNRLVSPLHSSLNIAQTLKK